jgi:hypothetical protein
MLSVLKISYISTEHIVFQSVLVETAEEKVEDKNRIPVEVPVPLRLVKEVKEGYYWSLHLLAIIVPAVIFSLWFAMNYTIISTTDRICLTVERVSDGLLQGFKLYIESQNQNREPSQRLSWEQPKA